LVYANVCMTCRVKEG